MNITTVRKKKHVISDAQKELNKKMVVAMSSNAIVYFSFANLDSWIGLQLIAIKIAAYN